MKIEPLGDSAFILRNLDVEPWKIAVALNKNPPPGLIEAVASYQTVGVYVDPFEFDQADFVLPPTSDSIGKSHTIPVQYAFGEDDLFEIEQMLGIDYQRVIDLHCSLEYDCYAIGFCPGFAYLGYLPEEIRGLPRMNQPRLKVTPGSVAITGDQTAVYPLERPGGWWIIGRTPLTLVEDDYFPIEAGDRVRFVPISAEEYHARKGERL